jgi:hypothetical protein
MQAAAISGLLAVLGAAALPQTRSAMPDVVKGLGLSDSQRIGLFAQPMVLGRIVPEAQTPAKGPGIDCTMMILRADPNIDPGFSVSMKRDVDLKMVVPSVCRE